MLFSYSAHCSHVLHRDRLTTGAVTRHVDNDTSHILCTMVCNGGLQSCHIKVALPIIVGSGVQSRRGQSIDGLCAIQFNMCCCGIKVVVGDKYRLVTLDAFDQTREQNLFCATALVSWNSVLVAKQLLYFLFHIEIVFATCVRLITHHQTGPLAVTHGTSTRISQQININIFTSQQERVIPCLFQSHLTILTGRHADRLNHFDAERLRNTFHF